MNFTYCVNISFHLPVPSLYAAPLDTKGTPIPERKMSKPVLLDLGLRRQAWIYHFTHASNVTWILLRRIPYII
jgi:hypothetical protein